MKEFLRKIEDNILNIKKRFYYLEAMHDELKSKVKSERFEIANDIVWQMYVDSYQMMIIDMASFCRGLCDEKEFLKYLCQHTNLFRLRSNTEVDRRIKAKNANSPNDKRINISIERDDQKRHNETLYELFPGSDKRETFKVTHRDIKNFIDNFESFSTKLLDVRDNIHAHQYENKNKKVAPLEFDEIKVIFQTIEKLLKKIRLVLLDSSFCFDNMNFADCDLVAKDVIDQILIGDNKQIFLRLGVGEELESLGAPRCYFEHFREKFYDNHSGDFSPRQ